MRPFAAAASLVCAVAVVGCSRGFGPQALPAGPAMAPSSIAPAAGTKVLHAFGTGADGVYPVARLTVVNGVLYGTTVLGGATGRGTVFSVTKSGAEKVLYSFLGGADGSYPLASAIALNGVLYGTTQSGGTYGKGTIFSVTTAGAERVLYSFGAVKKDGSAPSAGLLAVKGVLYGTTPAGGAHNKGTVFSVTTKGVEKVLYSFGSHGNDGVQPGASLAALGGTLYGTTVKGGKSKKGTVFSVTKSGTEKVLYSFTGGADGGSPNASLLNVGGIFYSTAFSGGSNGAGVVFKVSKKGAESVLHSFGTGLDGAGPYANLIVVSGKLYGTTVNGGANGKGIAFSMTTNGAEKILFGFGGPAKNGAFPWAALTNAGGTLYGTTRSGGGSPDSGTVFALKP
jgi:uncharacterized repeat protein (TIGR03803 family)